MVTLAVGPDDTLPCIQFGLFTIDDRGTPLVVLMRGPAEQHGLESVTLEVVAPESAAARSASSSGGPPVIVPPSMVGCWPRVA